MVNYIRAVSDGLAAVVPLSLLQALHSGKRLQRVILTYHGVSRESTSQCIAVNQLREHLKWAKEHYEIVRLRDLVRGLRSSDPGQKNQLAVTFDDGYRNFLDCAIPVLVELRIHATLFVPAAKVGGYNEWDANRPGYDKMPLLSFPELKSLPGDTVEIGSHGLNHIPLHLAPLETLEKEIRDSRDILEQGLERLVTLFSFPHGYHCDEGRPGNASGGKQLLRDAGYTAACTMRWGRFNSARDAFALHRVGVGPADTLMDFKNKLTGYYDWLTAKESLARWVRGTRARLTV